MVEFLELLRFAQLGNLHNSQSKNNADERDQNQTKTDVPAFPTFVQLVLYLDSHNTPPAPVVRKMPSTSNATK